jgi:hypothetical protein
VNTLGVFELNALFLLAGLGLLWACRGWETWASFLHSLGVAYMLGTATVLVGATLVLVAGAGLSTGVVVSLPLGLAAAGAVAGGLRRRPLPRGRLELAAPRTMGEIAATAGAGLTVLLLLEFFRAARLQPLVAFDAWNFWVPKAKAIYFFGGLDEQLFRTLGGPSYPLLVPALQAMDFRLIGSADASALALQYWFLFAGFVFAAASLLRGIAPRALVWLFLALAVVIPETEHRLLQLMGDWPLDIFFALAALFLVRWLLTRETWLLAGYGVCLCAVMATKREGLMLAACLVAGGLVAAWRDWRRTALPVVVLAVAAFAVNIPWRLWWTSRHLSSDTPDGGLGQLAAHVSRILPSARIVLELTFSYKLWLLVVPVALVAAAFSTTTPARKVAFLYLTTSVLAFVGFTWILWSDPTIALTTKPALSPIPRAVGALALLSVVVAPVLVARLPEPRLAAAFELRPGRFLAEALPRAAAWFAAVDKRVVLGGLVAVQWVLVLGLALTVAHNGWLYYQGGDEVWYYTTGWLAGHGHMTLPSVGYGWSFVLAPISWIGGPSVLGALPLIVLLNVLVLLPVALLCVYGIARMIGGRLFGYLAATIWVLAPYAGILFSNAQYHQRYTEVTLPQTLGLTAMADFPTMVAVLLSAYLMLRSLERFDWRLPLAAGIVAGFAIGMKPSTAIFLVVPAVAACAGRRLAAVVPFAAGLAPALLTLALWKWRGAGVVPLFAASGTPVAAGSDGVVGGLNSYLHLLDWNHLNQNRIALREYFWSGRVLEWLPIAGAVGLLRRSRRVGLVVVVWFGLYALYRGAYSGADLATASLLRLLMPAYPAWAILLAGIPFLVPGLARRAIAAARHESPRLRLQGRQLTAALGAGVLLLALVPLAAAATLRPASGDDLPALGLKRAQGEAAVQTPMSRSFTLTATRTDRYVELRWKPQRGFAGRVYYRIYRASGSGLNCTSAPRGADTCELDMSAVGATDQPVFDDPATPGTWTYRVTVGASWLSDPTSGDTFLISRPIRIAVR